MRFKANNICLNKSGSFAGFNIFNCFLDFFIRFYEICSINSCSVKIMKSSHHFCNGVILSTTLIGYTHRNCVLIVLNYKQYRKLFPACPVNCLVKFTLRSSTFSAANIRDVSFSFFNRSKCGTHGL